MLYYSKYFVLIVVQVSMADLVTVSLLEGITDGPGLDVIKAEPSVEALVARVKLLPNIQKWIKNRPAEN